VSFRHDVVVSTSAVWRRTRTQPLTGDL